MQRSLPDRLLSETEWRQLGVQQSRGWVHYAIHKYVAPLVYAHVVPMVDCTNALRLFVDLRVWVGCCWCWYSCFAGPSRTFYYSDVRLVQTRPLAASTLR